MPDLPPPPSLDDGPTAAPSSAVDALRQLRTAVGEVRAGFAATGRTVAAVAALLVVAAIAWGAYVRTGSSPPPPELTMPRAGAAGDAAAAGGADSTTSDRAAPTSSASSSPDTAAAVVYVHVAGAVARPGLYRLAGSPRVADAIDAAGGVIPTADLDAVNLAATVGDGERVYVPRVGEPPPAISAGGPAADGPIDLNAATVEQLDALPGVGPSTAQAIVDYRQEHGRFRSVDELLEVRGIGPSKLDDLRAKVRVR